MCYNTILKKEHLNVPKYALKTAKKKNSIFKKS